jgi:hypothetical protein
VNFPRWVPYFNFVAKPLLRLGVPMGPVVDRSRPQVTCTSHYPRPRFVITPHVRNSVRAKVRQSREGAYAIECVFVEG